MGLTIIAILGTQSRGALVGLVIMTLMLTWKTRSSFWVLLLMGPELYAGNQFMPQAWHDRMKSIETYQEDFSAICRINSWLFAFILAIVRPIVGGGYHSFTPDLFARYW